MGGRPADQHRHRHRDVHRQRHQQLDRSDTDAPTTSAPIAALDLSKSASPATYNTVGQVITYTYIGQEHRQRDADRAVHGERQQDRKPAGTPFACGSGPLAPNQISICTATYTITQADIDAGSVTNTASVSTSYTDSAGNSETVTSNSASATVNVQLGIYERLTHSASKSTTEISNQLVTDFEILLNGQNVIVATNPGQFFYHQWATNPYSITTSWSFVLDWTDKFEAQTVAGGPIKAYLQLPGSSSFVNWTSHATGICWNTGNGCPANQGRITVNDVPAGATVWVMAHIDFKPKGSNISTLTPNPMTRPVVYGPLSSTITIRNQQSSAVIGTSFSSTTVIGRGKKVTMLYGTASTHLVHRWRTHGSRSSKARTRRRPRRTRSASMCSSTASCASQGTEFTARAREHGRRPA